MKAMKGITCCGDCIHYNWKKHKCNLGCKDEGLATDHFYKDCPLPKVQPVNQWIPCSERLPECEWGAETEALMYQVGDTIYTGHFGRGGLWRDEYFRRYADIKEGVDASDVIAWMPLPEPYKESD